MSTNEPEPESDVDVASTRGKRIIQFVPPGFSRAVSPQVDEVRMDPALAEPEIRREPEAGGALTPALRQRFRDARAAGDMQGQLDVLFEALTGQQP